jgi:heat shock protein HslJ
MKILVIFLAIMISAVSLLNCADAKKSITETGKSNNLLPLQGTYWKLYALMGQRIPNVDSTLATEAYIILNKDGSEVGNGSCNKFGGDYELTGSSMITFGPIISTKIYCPAAKYENLFFDILSKADNYLIKGDTLYLRNKQMDSTAHFIGILKKQTAIK